MFLGNLDQTQKEVFMALAKRIALADWSMQGGEDEALEMASAQIGGSVEVQPGDIFGNDRIGCFDTEVIKRGVMYELLLIVHADQEVNEAESHSIGNLTADMGLSPAIVEELHKIARHHAAAIFHGQPHEQYWDQARAIVERDA